ncbi:hypothetical protein [Nocardia abscessus]|uniref:hypothetical protein n=1 Tax=Nocardia abscessus TaxID=120957 RepID=UPI0024577630|nr:hypothetical protein [Nocardia abscessus]
MTSTRAPPPPPRYDAQRAPWLRWRAPGASARRRHACARNVAPGHYGPLLQ